MNVEAALSSVEGALLDVAEAVEAKQSGATGHFDELLVAFKGLIDAKRRVGLRQSVVAKMKTRLVSGKKVDGGEKEEVDPDDIDALLARFPDQSNLLTGLSSFSAFYEQSLKDEFRKYDAKSDDEKYETAPEFIELKKKLAEILTTGPYSSNGSAGDMDVDSDEDLAIVGGQSNFKCPLTQMLMTNEIYTSSVCNHSFSDAIKQLIRSSQNGRAECPVAGCNKYVRNENLVRDKGMERKAKAHVRKLEEEEETNATQRPGVVIE
ncbi:hypothetical protein HDU99_007898 [Rhizoclosmatium hyalinum]|nr:hypothetical protein HDU99_007898 [Rhizoclosmatium hyalinum]